MRPAVVKSAYPREESMNAYNLGQNFTVTLLRNLRKGLINYLYSSNVDSFSVILQKEYILLLLISFF